MIYTITPVAKPRQTRADKWKKRPAVLKYRAFADECRLKIKGVNLDHKAITFHLPMPASWSQKKRNEMNWRLHRQRPDIDNLAPALFDARDVADSTIAHVMLTKRWGIEGSIEIGELHERVD